MSGIKFGSPDRRVRFVQGFLKQAMPMVLAVALALAALPVQALGLGELRVDSNLNEPFRGRIGLLSADAKAAIRDASVGLAAAEAFEEAKVPYAPTLGRLRFRLLYPRDAAPYIRVSSTLPIGDPHLHFIVEMRAGEARLLRHYTVLLDPPGPYQDRLASGLKTESAPVKTASAARTYGPVRYAETLWSIAAGLRPDASVSVQQMVLALQRANPRAFAGGNVNGLMSGAVLRVPDLEEIRSVDTRDAVTEVRRQNADVDANDNISISDGERGDVALDGDGGDSRDDVEASLSEVGAGEGAAELPVVEAEPEVKEENRRLRERIAVLERDLNDMLRLVGEPTDAGVSKGATTDRSSVQPPESDDSEDASKPGAVMVDDAAMDAAPQEIFLGLPSVDRRIGEKAIPEVEVVAVPRGMNRGTMDVSGPASMPKEDEAVEAQEALNVGEGAQQAGWEPVISPRRPPPESSTKPSDGVLAGFMDDPVVTGGGFVGLAALLAWIAVLLRRRNRRRVEEAQRGGFYGGVWRGAVAGEEPDRATDNPWEAGPADGATDPIIAPPTDAPADALNPREDHSQASGSRDTAVEILGSDEVVDLDDLDFERPGFGERSGNGGENTRTSGGSADSGEAVDDLDLIEADSDALTGLELDDLELSVDDRVATKLDLAKAYMDLGDLEGAGSMLDEVLSEGNADQRKEAKQLISELNASSDQ